MTRRSCLFAILTYLTLVGSEVRAVDDRPVPSNPRATLRQGQGGQMLLKRLDANKDGQVSKSEFESIARKAAQRAPGQAGGANRAKAGVAGGRIFNRLDTNKNGMLSPAEIEKLQQLRARQKGQR